MKISMKSDSSFRINIFPWLIYAIGTILYLAALIIKIVKRPELLPPLNTVLLALAGIVSGIIYMKFLSKKITSRRQYLSLKQSMIVVWVIGLIGVALTMTAHWTYYLCIFLAAMSIGYFFIYIPRFIETKIYLAEILKDLSQK